MIAGWKQSDLKRSYLWRSGSGGWPSSWHDLLCDVTPTLVGVSYSYLWRETAKRWLHFHGTRNLHREKETTKKTQTSSMCATIPTLLTHSCPQHNQYDCCLRVKGNVRHSTDKRLSAHSLLELQTMGTRLAFVATLYRLAFSLWWDLWLWRGLLRRRSLLLLLSGVDHDRCRLDRWGVLRLSWIVCSCCEKEWESGWKQWSQRRGRGSHSCRAFAYKASRPLKQEVTGVTLREILCSFLPRGL